METSNANKTAKIEILPEEIMEIIFSYLSPYAELEVAMLVCRQWHRILTDLVFKRQHNFHSMLRSNRMVWKLFESNETPSISGRHSHTACYCQHRMYVFGGCSSSGTTFNDLWYFDLTLRQWIRPHTMGNYPSPKASASFVLYKDTLMLYGGWSRGVPHPLHQAMRYFSELHEFHPLTNRWRQVTTLDDDVLHRVAGHSVSILSDCMVVFGGSHAVRSGVHVAQHTCHYGFRLIAKVGVGCWEDMEWVGGGEQHYGCFEWGRSNSVWMFDFEESMWKKPSVSGTTPSARYGQCQKTLDAERILIVGGCGGPNKVYSDVWLLTLMENEGFWQEVTVANSECSAPAIWCHPPCMMADMIVVASKHGRSSGSVSGCVRRRESRQHIFHANRNGSPFVNHSQALAAFRHYSRYIDEQRLSSPPAPPTLPSAPPPHRSDTRRIWQFGCATSRCRLSFEDCRPGLPCCTRHVDRSGSCRDDGVEDSSGCLQGSVNGNGECSCSDRVKFYLGSDSSPEASGSRRCAPQRGGSPRLSMPSVRPNAMYNRQMQLDLLRMHENRLLLAQSRDDLDGFLCHRRHVGHLDLCAEKMEIRARNPMRLYVLDIGHVVHTLAACWLDLGDVELPGAPDETIMFSMIQGHGELVLFGGIERMQTSMQRFNSQPDHNSSGTVTSCAYVLQPESPKRI